MSHTPGPWKVDAMGNIWGADTKVCDMSEQPAMAAGYYREKTDEEHKHNARLIAAAPELLEALKMAREELGGLPHSLGYTFTHLPKIDAAIAKAEGKP